MRWYILYHNTIMNMRITIDKAGRMILPKSVRHVLGLEAGDTLELNVQGENISLHPVRNTSPLRKKKGVWVYRTGRPLNAAAIRAARDSVRQDREERVLGPVK
ncbi:MAG: AbrB/MazE/SpoVT family DNA-binding domain-containing protein [Phycisphaerae bacterium]